MRATIEGFRYDTDKAELVGEAISTTSVPPKMHWWHAELYVTPRAGRCFLAGQGGPMSRFAEPNGDMGGKNERIILLSRTGAMRWAAEYLGDDGVARLMSILGTSGQ